MALPRPGASVHLTPPARPRPPRFVLRGPVTDARTPADKHPAAAPRSSPQSSRRRPRIRASRDRLLIADTSRPPSFAVTFASARTDSDAGCAGMAERLVEPGPGQPDFRGVEGVPGARDAPGRPARGQEAPKPGWNCPARTRPFGVETPRTPITAPEFGRWRSAPMYAKPALRFGVLSRPSGRCGGRERRGRRP